MRISDWSSDVCSSDLQGKGIAAARRQSDDMAMKDNVTAICIGSDGCGLSNEQPIELGFAKIGVHPHPSKRYDGHQWRASRDLLTDLDSPLGDDACDRCNDMHMTRSEEQTSELQSLMRNS